MLSVIFLFLKATGRWNPEFAFDTPIELVLLGLDVIIICSLICAICSVYGYFWRRKREPPWK